MLEGGVSRPGCCSSAKSAIVYDGLKDGWRLGSWIGLTHCPWGHGELQTGVPDNVVIVGTALHPEVRECRGCGCLIARKNKDHCKKCQE